MPVSTFAQNSSQISETMIPLEGLDPVMLAEGKEVQGDMKFRVTRGPFQYIFANEKNKEAFEREPERYEIQLNGSCARMGAPTSGNPDLFAVYKERIYIFGSAECQTLFKAAPEKYLEVPASPKEPPTDEMHKRGQQLIAKAVESLGGPKLDQLVSFQTKDQRGNESKNTLLLVFPDKLRQETVRPTFTLVSVLTPAESFLVVNNSARPLPKANREAIHQALHHELIVLLRFRNRSDFKAWVADKSRAGETEVEDVEIELGEFTTMLGIEPTTGRVLSQTYRGRGPGGIVGEIVINYSDFRSVDGMLLPFKTTATFDGESFPALSSTIEATTVNGKVDPASFEKPVKQ
jgi:YHS domain-containing protein